MKTVLAFLITILLGFNQQLNAQWIRHFVPDNIGAAVSMDIFNMEKNIISGYIFSAGFPVKAAIINTTNGGRDWLPSIIDDDSAAAISAVKYINENLVYSCGARWVVTDKNKIFNKNHPIFNNQETFLQPLTHKGLYNVAGGGLEQRGAFYKSFDGGLNWILYNSLPDSISFVMDFAFVDENTGYILGLGLYQSFGAVLKTTDGGDSWQTVFSLIADTSNSAVFLNSMELISNDEIYFTGNAVLQGSFLHLLYHTTNAGQTWSSKNIEYSLLNEFHSLSFRNSQTGYISGYQGESGVIKTNDSSLSWFALNPATTAYIYTGINAAINTDWLLICGYSITENSQIVCSSFDGGLKWDTDLFNSDFFTTRCYFFENGLRYFLGGTGNNAIIYSNSSLVSVDDNENTIVNNFNLEQNYPNPFNPITKISWQSPVSGWQTLKIYDVLGNEVAALVNEYRNAGKYEINFNIGETSQEKLLPSGVYFYKLQVGVFSETKKMILLK